MAAPPLSDGPIALAPRPRRIDRFELAVLTVFGLVSVWVLGLDLWQVVAHGRVWTGTDGFFLTDQMQYVAWIRDASRHVLASNLFVLRSTPADYIQPVIAISGGITALGMAPWLVLLLWKPVAVLAAFFAIRAYARSSLKGLWERRTVLVLGLFFGSFGVIGDMWTGFWSWGYPFGLLALAAEFWALIAYDRARTTGALLWVAPLLGAIASSLHPWQGETLIVIVIVVEWLLLRGRRPSREQLVLPAVTVLATALPLAYYAILARADLSWQLARGASRHSYPLSHILLSLAPLLLPALLAFRERPRTFLAAATRVWLLAALGIYVVSSSGVAGTPLHAFAGITVPLAVLAVQGVQRVGWSRLPRRRLLGALAVAAATIPATVYELSTAHEFMAPTPGNANFITRDERDALDYLARDPDPGGVLTRFYLGTLVPAETGRRTWVGDCLWSEPHCAPRAKIAQMVFDGSLPGFATRGFVSDTGARFILADCDSRPDLATVLAPITLSVHRFGCASVYLLATPRPPTGPLAQSPPDAALRAQGRQQRRVQPS